MRRKLVYYTTILPLCQAFFESFFGFFAFWIILQFMYDILYNILVKKCTTYPKDSVYEPNTDDSFCETSKQTEHKGLWRSLEFLHRFPSFDIKKSPTDLFNLQGDFYHTSLLPSNARKSVISSAYSRSAPTGTP